MEAFEIRVTGTVQGVGFRPNVWRLATEEGIEGQVLNDGAGVLITAAGNAEAVSRFVQRLQTEAPPLSRIESIQTRPVVPAPRFEGFRICDSVPGENRTRVAPDAAVCAACAAEVLDPADRRHRYPFANCTHCGPRFSIVMSVPYDRDRTTMGAFPMCGACAGEYANPADRRFHAQPIACATCGPHLWLESLEAPGPAGGPAGPRGDEALGAAVERLKQGDILAIRGLGGFHLACDATNAGAVGRLRDRKRRQGKPFALMAKDLEVIHRHCTTTPEERRLLESPEAPIVLLPADGPEPLPGALAPGMGMLGFMLPYTPLHLLLMRQIDRPLVMTSGNLTSEPQVTGNDEARVKLRGIADAVLMHDREIANRIDDSVVRIAAGKPRLLRRARGYAPAVIAMPAGFEAAPDLLAYGGELKATFCLFKGGASLLSQHQGDLEDVTTFEDYQKNLSLYTAMYGHQPRLLAADLHPEYLSAKLAEERSAADGLPLLRIQHHHAHVAGCMAENGVPLDGPPVLGLAFDGLGFGGDGTLWGGEVMLADYRGYRRVAALKPVAMPGGTQAIREPWRNTYAHLVAAMGWEGFTGRFPGAGLRRYLEGKPLQAIDRMLHGGLNTPLASSCGRLFDAVAAAVGLCPDVALFEGQGAMELEAAAARGPRAAGGDEPGYPFELVVDPRAGLLLIDPAPMWHALLDDLGREAPVPVVAARFHRGLAASLAEVVRRFAGDRSGTDTPVEAVALSGGCFQNRILFEDVVGRIEAQGFRCLSHSRVPSNDGGLALGQAAIAAAHLLRGSTRPARPPGAESCA